MSRTPPNRPVWTEPEAIPVDLDALCLHRDPLLAALLYRRRIRTRGDARAFLATAPRSAPDPYALPGMEAAVARVCRAIEGGERVAVFGDYDADGVTSTALLVRALSAAMGLPIGPPSGRVAYRIPTRTQGYGLNRAALDAFADGGATLLIAVDCASSDPEHVAYAVERGLDIVVLDHHQMPDGDPITRNAGGREAGWAVVVSAHRPPDGDEPVPDEGYRGLSACGVAYLLVSALAQRGCRVGDGAPETDYQDLVALGTIGDVSPLLGPNRSLVRDGLNVLRERPRAGVAALCRRAGVEPAALDASAVAFKLAPRLNAAGRMSDPAVALQLLLTDDPRRAAVLADKVEALNRDRRDAVARVVAEADDLLQADATWADRRVAVVRGTGWPWGVLGIAANQLVERHGRPAIVLHDDGETARGSARSVPGFDVVAALGAPGCRELLGHHGGHGQAAGLSLPSANVAALADRLDRAVDAQGVGVPIPPTLAIDADLPAERLTLATARVLGELDPFGAGNPVPLLRLRRLPVQRYAAMGADRRHLKLFVGGGATGAPVEVLMWGAADRSRELLTQPEIDLVATVGIDHWQGRPRLQVVAQDFRPAE